MFIWPVMYGWCEKTTYSMLIDELTRGLKPNYSLDLFGVITASHFFSIFSQTIGTYILYIVPMYLVFKAGGYAMSYLKQRSADATTEEEDQDPSDAKRASKKER